jgi:hypothetical protein
VWEPLERSRTLKRSSLRIALVVLSILCLMPLLSGSAEAKKKKTYYYHYEYAVEFTCGVSGAETFRVVPGEYATVVNVQNPHGADAAIIKNLALTYPPGGQVAGPVSGAIQESLEAGKALQVSCEEITSVEFVFPEPLPPTDYIQGFLMIESNRSLNVISRNTASNSGEVSIDVEEILPRKFRTRAPGHKSTICHVPPGNPGNRRTISVDHDSWPAHEAHGDFLGSCN